MENKKSEVKRGRKPRVDENIIFEGMKKRKNEIMNERGLISSISDNVWKDLSKDLDYKLPSNSLYIMFYENKHGWKSKLTKILGLDENIENLMVDNISSSDSENSLQSNKHEHNKTLFKITIPFHIFSKIKPTTVTYKDKQFGHRIYEILPPGIWTDTINDLFLKEHKLLCNFIYKRIKVSRDILNNLHYIWFCAKCKDRNAEMEGWADTEPKGSEPLILSFFIKDTRGTETSHGTKRPLKGLKRRNVGQDLSMDVGSNWRRTNVRDLEFGCTSPPNLYNLYTLSKAKQQFKDKSLGIIEKCPIKSLVEFKHNSTYAGSESNT